MKSKYYVTSVVTVLCIIFSVVFAVKKAESATAEWNNRTSNTTRNLEDIASNGTGTQVMAVGDQDVVVSSDGSNWTNLGSVGTNVYFLGLLNDSAQWIAVGSDPDSGVIYTSPDGLSWTIRHNSGPVLRDIASNGSVHVAVGDNGTILRSTNGTNWTPQTSGTTAPLLGVAYGNGAFVAVGFALAAFPTVVLTSDDGSNWSDHSDGAGLAIGQGLEFVEYLNDRFVASGVQSGIRYSIDKGENFITSNRTSSEYIPAFAYGNTVYFAAGIDSPNDIDLVSIDGENWDEVTPSLAVPDDRNGAIFFNDTFITVGNSGSIRQSADCSDNDTDGLCNPVQSYFDVDGDGDSDALSDGLMILRNMFGFVSPALCENALLPEAPRTCGEVEFFINAGKTSLTLDVDGNGAADALTDGLMLLRRMFGFAPPALCANAMGGGATRTCEEITTYIDQHL